MKKTIKALLVLVCLLSVVLALGVVSSAAEYEVSSASEFNTAFASAVDGDTIVIKASLSATLDFGKSITYILDGDGIVWTAGAQNTATGKHINVYSKNGSNSFLPDASMWCNSYGLTVANLTSTSWTLGAADENSTLKLDLDKVDGRLFYGTFLNEISLLSGTVVTNLYSTNGSGDTNYFKCTTMNIYEGVEIYGNYSSKSLIDVTTLNMYGGEIYGNVCVGMWSGVDATNINMYGGSIHNNYQPEPHSVNTNASDPQRVAFVNGRYIAIYAGEIYSNYVGYGHKDASEGTSAGLSNRYAGSLYIADYGLIHSNVLVTLGKFGEYVLGENGCYTCEIDSADYSEDSASRQYIGSYNEADYSVIFKNSDSSVIDAFMVKSGAVIKSVSGASEVVAPSDVNSWTSKMNYCNAVELVLSEQGTYYAAIEHVVAQDDFDCTTALACVKCAHEFASANESHNEKITITYSDFITDGTKLVECQNEGCNHSQQSVASALVEYKGISSSQNSGEICVGYVTNVAAINEYVSAGNTFEIGVVAYIPIENETVIDPIGTDLNAKDEYTISAGVNAGVSAFDFVLRGFSADYYDLPLVFCAYVFDGEDVDYVCVGADNSLAQHDYAQTLKFSDYLE